MKKERRERDIAGALAVYDEYTHPRDETLPRVHNNELMVLHKSGDILP